MNSMDCKQQNDEMLMKWNWVTKMKDKIKNNKKTDNQSKLH